MGDAKQRAQQAGSLSRRRTRQGGLLIVLCEVQHGTVHNPPMPTSVAQQPAKHPQRSAAQRTS